MGRKPGVDQTLITGLARVEERLVAFGEKFDRSNASLAKSVEAHSVLHTKHIEKFARLETDGWWRATVVSIAIASIVTLGAAWMGVSDFFRKDGARAAEPR